MAGLITVASKVAKLEYWYLPGVATVAVAGYMTWSYLDDVAQSPAGATGIKFKTIR